MAESDLVLTDIDLDDQTIITFLGAYHSGAPVHWNEQAWHVKTYHHTINTSARYTFELARVPPDNDTS